jgi:hypothetical protein
MTLENDDAEKPHAPVLSEVKDAVVGGRVFHGVNF